MVVPPPMSRLRMPRRSAEYRSFSIAFREDAELRWSAHRDVAIR